jgi:hypothetical protein
MTLVDSPALSWLARDREAYRVTGLGLARAWLGLDRAWARATLGLGQGYIGLGPGLHWARVWARARAKLDNTPAPPTVGTTNCFRGQPTVATKGGAQY